MKPVFIFLFILVGFSASSQHENIPTTDNVIIEGKVKKTMTVSLADLASYKSH